LFQLPALPSLRDGHNVDIISGGHDIPERQNGTSKPLDASLSDDGAGVNVTDYVSGNDGRDNDANTDNGGTNAEEDDSR